MTWHSLERTRKHFFWTLIFVTRGAISLIKLKSEFLHKNLLKKYFTPCNSQCSLKAKEKLSSKSILFLNDFHHPGKLWFDPIFMKRWNVSIWLWRQTNFSLLSCLYPNSWINYLLIRWKSGRKLLYCKYQQIPEWTGELTQFVYC